jgi:hypothetical protein
MLADRNVPVDDNGNLMRANITTQSGKPLPRGVAEALTKGRR